MIVQIAESDRAWTDAQMSRECASACVKAPRIGDNPIGRRRRHDDTYLTEGRISKRASERPEYKTQFTDVQLCHLRLRGAQPSRCTRTGKLSTIARRWYTCPPMLFFFRTAPTHYYLTVPGIEGKPSKQEPATSEAQTTTEIGADVCERDENEVDISEAMSSEKVRHAFGHISNGMKMEVHNIKTNLH